MKIKAHTRSSFVGACARGGFLSICLAIEAVMSWLILSKMNRDFINLILQYVVGYFCANVFLKNCINLVKVLTNEELLRKIVV